MSLSLFSGARPGEKDVGGVSDVRVLALKRATADVLELEAELGFKIVEEEDSISSLRDVRAVVIEGARDGDDTLEGGFWELT